jgi:hypothetical protein
MVEAVVTSLKAAWDLAKDVRDAVRLWKAKQWMLALGLVFVCLVGGAAADYLWKNSQSAKDQEKMVTLHGIEVNQLKGQIDLAEKNLDSQSRTDQAMIAEKDYQLSLKAGEIASLSKVVATSEARASMAETAVATRDTNIADKHDQIAVLSTRLTELLATPTVTTTPASMFEPSSTPTPDVTHLITITSTAIFGSSYDILPPVGSDCDAELLAVVKRANSSWIDFVKRTKAQTETDFVKGTKAQTELDAPWGEASKSALDKVILLRKSLRELNASLVDLKYESRGCKVINQIGDKKVDIETNETWEYSAILTCNNRKVTDKKIETYNQQNYRLLNDSDGWRLVSWEPGDRTVIDDWLCK